MSNCLCIHGRDSAVSGGMGHENKPLSQPCRSTSPRIPWHNKLPTRGCASVSHGCWLITVCAGSNLFWSSYRPRTIRARFRQLSCGAGSSHLSEAPAPKIRPLRVRRRDVSHTPVALCEQAQLLQPLVPRGLEEFEVKPDLRRARATQLAEPGRFCTSMEPKRGRPSTREI